LISAMNGAVINPPADLTALLASAGASIANISINPLSSFADSMTVGNLRVAGTSFSSAFTKAVAAIDKDYGLKSDPPRSLRTIPLPRWVPTPATWALVLGALINEDQHLCPAGRPLGILKAALAMASDVGALTWRNGSGRTRCGGPEMGPRLVNKSRPRTSRAGRPFPKVEPH
jgi:hypothetical protein